jgi:hypothetical protein
MARLMIARFPLRQTHPTSGDLPEVFPVSAAVGDLAVQPLAARRRAAQFLPRRLLCYSACRAALIGR